VLNIPYPNEHAARVADPDSFDPQSMRSKDLGDGVRIIIGKKPGSASMVTQAYRFDKDQFTAAQARAWLKDHDIKFMDFEPAEPARESVFDSSAAHFRLLEAGKTGLMIDVHIISPGWGSSGYYSEKVLRKACESGVYPEGMHMHIDHPTRTAAKEQPARTIKGESPLAAILTKPGQYLQDGWDGPGVYAQARVLPQFVEDIKAMDGHIGISHYVSGASEVGTADGRSGPIITELMADELNTVDFVTVPGAGGHYRTLFGEMKVRRDPNPDNDQKKEDHMADKQESLTLAEIRTNHPEVFDEMKKTISEELKIEVATKDQTKKLEEAATTIRTLKEENAGLKAKIAESAASEYIKAEIGKAKLPEASGKLLTDALMKQIPLTESGEVDAPKLAEAVKAAITAKTEEIAAIRKEAGGDGIKGNGAPAGGNDGDAHKALVESFERVYLAQGKTAEVAKRMAESAAGGR
jgi:hypothetical protein